MMELPDIGSWIRSAIRSALSSVRSFVYSVVRPIWREIRRLWDSLSHAISAIREWVQKTIKDLSEWVRDALKDVINYVGQRIRELTTWVNTAIRNALDWVGERLKDLSAWVRQVVAESIRRLNELKDWVVETSKRLWDAITKVMSFVNQVYLFSAAYPVSLIMIISDYLDDLLEDVNKWAFATAYEYFHSVGEDIVKASEHLFEDLGKALNHKVEDLYNALYQKITEGGS